MGGVHLPADRDSPPPTRSHPRARGAACGLPVPKHPATRNRAAHTARTQTQDRVALFCFGARTIAPAQKAFGQGNDEEALRRFAVGVLGRESYGRVPEERKQQMRENVNAFRAQMLGAGFPPLAEEHVRGVTAPTLLITGERTPAFRRHLSDRLYQLLPGAEGIGIAGASHRLHEENPTAVNEAILTFINEHL